MGENQPDRKMPWLLFIPMGMGIAVGGGVLRQPAWDSRVLQTLAAAGLAAAVGLVVFLLMRAIGRWRKR